MPNAPLVTQFGRMIAVPASAILSAMQLASVADRGHGVVSLRPTESLCALR
jgi:hypothetical protein